MEELKNALSVGIDIADAVKSALADNQKIDGVDEYISIGLKTVKLVKVVKDAAKIKEQYLNLTEEQKTELIDWFAEEFDLENDDTEAVVESVFSVLIGLGGLITELG